MKRIVLCILILAVSSFSYAQEKSEGKKDNSLLGALLPGPSKDKVLGDILKGVLENYHITKKDLDDNVSKNAFALYVERIDYGKQFLIESDVDELEKFESEFDDQMGEGRLKVIDVTSRIMKKRIPFVRDHVKAILKKDFNFKKKEAYETDSKKRKFVDSEKALKERWRKLIKLEVLVQYFELKDEQDGVETKKSKKKKKKKVAKKKTVKKKSFKELMVDSRAKVQKRYKRVFKRLLDERKSDQLDKFYNSIAKVYDPHTHYFVPEEKEDFDIDMSGKLEGIGALLREEGSFIKVERIIPGSASWKGKELKAEDVILAVSQDKKEYVDIVDMGIRDAVKLIRGKKGTSVFLKVKKPAGNTAIIAIVRDKVVLEESYVKGTTIKHEKLGINVGYIKVPKFYRDFQDQNGRNCSDDVKNELVKINKTDAKAVILDLRNNGGGALIDATLMGGLFIDKGPMVQVKRTGVPDVKRDTDGKVYWDKTLIVLINRFSASASEIVAGAMKDYKRAVIVGSSEQTHGKGTVQAILDLSDFLRNKLIARKVGNIGAMKITTDMFYRINGMSTQFRGVVPDIKLPDQYGFMETGEKTLDYAIPYAEVDAVKFNKWTKSKYKLGSLVSKSGARVKKNKQFKQILESVEWSKERKDLTKRSLNLKNMKAFRDEAKKVSDKYDDPKVNKNLTVKSLKTLKNSSEKESFKEFKEGLQKDPVIEETMFIINDILKS